MLLIDEKKQKSLKVSRRNVIILNQGVCTMTRMKELRKQCKERQEDIAPLIGITRGAYANIENGKREADYETLIFLADHFGVTVDYLLGRDGVPTPDYKPGFGVTDSEKTLVLLYRDLNEEGQEKAMEFAEFLVNSGRYIKLYQPQMVSSEAAAV